LPSCYDEWILPERDRVRHLFFSAAQRLITLLAQEREYDAAIKVAQQLLRHDPLHEATYRKLMRFYDKSWHKGRLIGLFLSPFKFLFLSRWS
jgi:DNA-binding SARP family transcriptional activator